MCIRDRREYEMQNRQFPEMEEDGRLKEYLDRCAFINKEDVYKRQVWHSLYVGVLETTAPFLRRSSTT